MCNKSMKVNGYTNCCFLFFFLFLIIISFSISSFSQDCPSCPKKEEEDKKQTGQQATKEYMDGDMKVVVIPSRYSKEELEKMFPVPEQWKEWYRLEKEGKLPKYVKIYDAKKKYIKYTCTPDSKCIYKMDYLADILIFSKELSLNFDEKNIKKLRKIVADGGNYGWAHFYMELYDNPYLSVSLIPLLFEGLEAKNGLDSYSFQDRVYDVIQNFLLHPLYFKDEINSLKNYIPDFWKLYENAGKIKTNPDDITLLKFTALNSLYLLDEDINKITSAAKSLNFQKGILLYSHLYFDPVNSKEIEFSDFQIKPLYNWIYTEMPSDRWAAFRYYSCIGEGERYLDKMIEYCKYNFNENGLEVFELLGEFKTKKSVRDLINYYNNNKSKFSKDNDDYNNYERILRNVFGL